MSILLFTFAAVKIYLSVYDVTDGLKSARCIKFKI